MASLKRYQLGGESMRFGTARHAERNSDFFRRGRALHAYIYIRYTIDAYIRTYIDSSLYKPCLRLSWRSDATKLRFTTGESLRACPFIHLPFLFCCHILFTVNLSVMIDPPNSFLICDALTAPVPGLLQSLVSCPIIYDPFILTIFCSSRSGRKSRLSQ